jgi:hypothetical protein
VIWVSILGVAPFTLLLPHANLPMTAVLSVIIGFVLSSAFSAILVYAQELMPGKVGMVSGLFFGFAFGMGGIGSAILGQLIDLTNIRFVSARIWPERAAAGGSRELPLTCFVLSRSQFLLNTGRSLTPG